jgi:adhesin/invasin
MERDITLTSSWLGGAVRRGTGLALAALGVVGACGSDNNITPLVATTITAVAATNAQTGAVGKPLAQPVGVLVVDQNGAPFANATVNWAVQTGGGSVASATSVTDATGTATVVWTMGPTAGTDSLKASLANSASVFITATATTATAATISITSGGTQSVTAGSTTAPLVVQVLDASASPVSGAVVTWAVTGGGTLSAATSTTDATGKTQVTLTTAAKGTYTVTAKTGTLTAVTFTITAT